MAMCGSGKGGDNKLDSYNQSLTNVNSSLSMPKNINGQDWVGIE